MHDWSHLLDVAGEDWEVSRGGQVIGTVRGMRIKQKQKMDFPAGADIQEGDVLTGSNIAWKRHTCLCAWHGYVTRKGSRLNVKVI